MRIEYIREVHDSFMQIVSEEDAENYQIKMLENNEPEGFLKLTIRNVDGIKRMLYRISSYISMDEFYIKKTFDWEDVNNLIKSFMCVFDSVEKYMIDYDGLLLNPEYIYTDGKGRWRFAYYYGKTTSFREDIKILFEYVIRRINHKDTKAVTAAYGIYKRICDGNVNPRQLFDMEVGMEDEGIVEKEYIRVESVIPEMATDEVEEKDYVKIYAVYAVMFVYAVLIIYVVMGIFINNIRLCNAPGGVYVFVLVLLICGGIAAYRWYERNKEYFVKVKEKQVEIPFEKSHVRVILPKENPQNELTTVLTDEADNSRHFLKWSDITGQKEYELNDRITIIGSSADRADCVITEKGISRIHARISNEDYKFYIKDMNSTNGTKVNGRELACYELCEIKSNDRIELGNKECIFI